MMDRDLTAPPPRGSRRGSPLHFNVVLVLSQPHVGPRNVLREPRSWLSRDFRTRRQVSLNQCLDGLF